MPHRPPHDPYDRDAGRRQPRADNTYFADKSALLRELQELAEPELASMLTDSITGAGTPQEGLLRVCVAYVAFARRHRWLHEASTGFAEQVTALLDARDCQAETTAQALPYLRIAIEALVETDAHREADSREFVERYVKLVLRGL